MARTTSLPSCMGTTRSGNGSRHSVLSRAHSSLRLEPKSLPPARQGFTSPRLAQGATFIPLDIQQQLLATGSYPINTTFRSKGMAVKACTILQCLACKLPVWLAQQIGDGGRTTVKLNEDGKLLAWDEEAGVEVEMLMPEGADLWTAVGKEVMLLDEEEFSLLRLEVVETRIEDDVQGLSTLVSGGEGGASPHRREAAATTTTNSSKSTTSPSHRAAAAMSPELHFTTNLG